MTVTQRVLSPVVILTTIVLSSCTAVTTNKGTMVIPSQTAELTNTPQSRATPSESRPTPAQFQVIDINPVKMVPFGELALGPSMEIVAVGSAGQKLFRLSSPTFVAQEVSSFPVSARIDSIRFSPDGSSFVYLLPKPGSQGNVTHYELWLSSATKNDQSLILKDLEGGVSISWINNSQLAIWKKYGNTFDCPGGLQIVDLPSGTIKTLPDLPTNSEVFCFPMPFFSPTLSKAIYLEEGTGWKQIDYESSTTTDILPTLQGMDISPVGGKYFHWGLSGLSFALPNSSEIQFARNLNETEFTTPNQFNSVQLPGNESINGNLFQWSDLETGFVAFDLKTNNDTNSGLTFVVANLADLALKNYFMDRSSFDGYKGITWQIVPSSDGRFLSWAIMAPPKDYPALGSVILDTKTGEASFLKGYQILGFAEIEH